jgi:hypothetical protein
MSIRIWAVTAMVVTLGACSSGGSAAKPKHAATGATTPESSADLSKAELQSALLKLGDLPAGYARTVRQGMNSKPPGFCGKPSPWFATSPTGQVLVRFARAQPPTEITEGLASMPSEAQAEHEMQQAKADSSSCKQFNTKSGGRTWSADIAFVAFPKMGDDTFAIDLRLTTSDTAFESKYVYVRTGALLISVSTLTPLTAEAPNLEPVARAALKRARQAIAVLPAT